MIFFVPNFTLFSELMLSYVGIRAVPSFGNQGFGGFINLAILRYLGAPITYPPDPTQNIPSSVLPLNETDLHVGFDLCRSKVNYTNDSRL